MCSSEEQKNQVQKSYTRVETCGSFWFAMFKRYWKCFYSIFMLSRALRKGLRQPTNFWDSGKERYYSFKITQFLKDNFWSVIGHKLQLSLLRKKKNILRPEMSKLLGLCQIIIPTGKVRCRRVSLFNKMTYLGIYDREPLKLSIVHMNKWLLCHGALQ